MTHFFKFETVSANVLNLFVVVVLAASLPHFCSGISSHEVTSKRLPEFAPLNYLQLLLMLDVDYISLP